MYDEQGQCIIDYVGRFEELQTAIDTVARRLGFDSAPLGVHNASTADRALAELLCSDDDYQFLHDVYRRDFELFGYDPMLRL